MNNILYPNHILKTTTVIIYNISSNHPISQCDKKIVLEISGLYPIISMGSVYQKDEQIVLSVPAQQCSFTA